MKSKIIAISLLATLLVLVVVVGSSLSVDPDFLASLIPEPVAEVIGQSDDPCDGENLSEEFAFACEDMTGEITNSELVGSLQEPVSQTSSVKETQKVVEEKQTSTTSESSGSSNASESSNSNVAQNDFSDFDFDALEDLANNEDAVDTSVFYLDNSDVPTGVEPDTEVLEDYTNLFVYDFYEGEITEDESRVFVDDSKYDVEKEGLQTVYLNVLEPSGRLSEYRVNLNVVPNSNKYDVKEPVFSMDANMVELTEKQYETGTNQEIIDLLVQQQNFSIVDDYDGDMTYTPNMEIRRVDKNYLTDDGFQKKLIITVHDENLNYATQEVSVSIVPPIDTEAPRIFGNDQIEIYDGQLDLYDFETLGISAYDEYEGDVTDRIKVLSDGNFDPNVVGNYTIDYYVTDSYGNRANVYSYTIHVGKQVETCDDLNDVRDNLQIYYQQTADIDCAGVEFYPIGSRFDSFDGGYDGNGYIIDNLTVKQDNDGYGGLFGSNKGLIKNVHLTNFNSLVTNVVGGIAGFNASDGIIANSSVKGKLTAVNGIASVGGIVGVNSGLITNTYADVILDGYEKVGGLVGENSYGDIRNSYAKSLITNSSDNLDVSENSAGGLVGHGNASLIENSYAVSTLEPLKFSHVGGIVGHSESDRIINTYTDVTGQASDVAGNVAGLNEESYIENAYTSNDTLIDGSEVFEDAIRETLLGEDFFNKVLVEPVAQSNFAVNLDGLPLVKYTDVNGFGTKNIMRGQILNTYVRPDVGDKTIIPEIVGDNLIEINIDESVEIQDPIAMGLQAFDSFGEDITENIELVGAGGYEKNKVGEFDVAYAVTDDLGRESLNFVVKIIVTDNIPPTLVGPQTREVKYNTALDFTNPYVMGLVSYDQDRLFTNHIQMIDNDGFVGDGNDDAGVYNVVYQATDEAGNKSEKLTVVISVVKEVIEIETCAELQSIGKGDGYQSPNPDKEYPSDGNYLITQDLDCSEVDATSQTSLFKPIVLTDGAIIDGANHKISNITLDDNSDYLAMFRSVGDVTLKDFELVNLTVDGRDYASGLIGQVKGQATVKDVMIDATINGRNHASFVVGEVTEKGSLLLEHNDIEGQVVGLEYTSVLVGYLHGDIETVFNHIDVEYRQQIETQFELIGKVDPLMSSEDYIDLVEGLVSKNFITIDKMYIDEDGNVVRNEGTIHSEPTKGEEEEQVDDGFSQEAQATDETEIDNPEVIDELNPSEPVNDEPVPIIGEDAAATTEQESSTTTDEVTDTTVE